MVLCNTNVTSGVKFCGANEKNFIWNVKGNSKINEES